MIVKIVRRFKIWTFRLGLVLGSLSDNSLVIMSVVISFELSSCLASKLFDFFERSYAFVDYIEIKISNNKIDCCFLVYFLSLIFPIYLKDEDQLKDYKAH